LDYPQLNGEKKMTLHDLAAEHANKSVMEGADELVWLIKYEAFKDGYQAGWYRCYADEVESKHE